MAEQDKDKEKSNRPKPEQTHWTLLYLMVGLVIVAFVNDFFYTSKHIEDIPYSQFLKEVDAGKIADVTISDTRIVGEYKTPATPPKATTPATNPKPLFKAKAQPNVKTTTHPKAQADAKPPATVGPQPQEEKKQFVTIPMTDEMLVSRLQKNGVTFRAEPKSSMWNSVISWLFPLIIFYALWTFLFRRASGMASGGLLGMTKSKAKIFVEKDVKTTFADVAGVDEAKEELEEIVGFLKDPEKYNRLGGRAPKGVLLVGPPGTGKTLLARALAGEAKVPFFSINGSEFVEMFVGLGAARVRELFQDARAQAPCIIFIDEVDALGKSRAYNVGLSGSNDEKEQTLHQLLAEMDGFDTSQGVIILAATNRPEVLDPALLRAGRFDRQILVNSPDQAGRAQILRVHIKRVKLDDTVDLEKIAALTAGFSGADLANLINEAALIAVRRGADAVSQTDFNMAIERIVAGLEHKKRLMNPDEKKRVAFHEMGHATVLLALKLPDKLHKVSIIPRGLGALGYTIQRPIEDRYLVDYDELIAKVAVLLGGRASEKIFFATVSTGASDDLVKATEMARAMITQYAMGDKLGLATFEERHPTFLTNGLQPQHQSTAFSEKTAEEIDLEIKEILDVAFQKAMTAVEDNRNFVQEAVAELLKTETLDEEDLARLWKKELQKTPTSPTTPAPLEGAS